MTAWMLLVAEAVATIVSSGGLQEAFALALALQFAWQFASTMQPPESLPPLQEIGV